MFRRGCPIGGITFLAMRSMVEWTLFHVIDAMVIQRHPKHVDPVTVKVKYG